MALDFSFLQGASSTSDLTTYTFAGQNLGAADADRRIIVCVESRNSPSGLTSVTVGGVTATLTVTQVTNDGGVNNLAAIAIAAVPTGATGDVVVTFGSGAARCAIQLYRVVGLSGATAYRSGASGADDPTVNLDVPTGGCAVGCAVIAASTSVTWTGLTEDVDTVVETNTTVTSASLAPTTVEAGRTLTATFAAGTNGAGAFASWTASAGSSAGAPYYYREHVAGGVL